MRLKRVELAGFKSFVDPTKIDLGEGITGIVGPNGCGKSNIVDAIRWVLGEHSAKHLRGGVMDDLVFQGSQTRPPVAMCDVELTFSVNPGQLSAPYHEMEEIRVRRRLHRESGSDAFINGKMVRIKDIVDLFLGYRRVHTRLCHCRTGFNCAHAYGQAGRTATDARRGGGGDEISIPQTRGRAQDEGHPDQSGTRA